MKSADATGDAQRAFHSGCRAFRRNQLAPEMLIDQDSASQRLHKCPHMLTPVLMLLILTLPYVVARLMPAVRRSTDPATLAAMGLGLMFFFTASGHFAQAQAMAQMLPPWVPARVGLVYLTGVLEVLVGIGLLVARWRRVAGWAAAAMLVGFFPANVYAALEHVPMGGHAWGPVYLLVRAPLQAIVLGWLWIFVLRPLVPPGSQGS